MQWLDTIANRFSQSNKLTIIEAFLGQEAIEYRVVTLVQKKNEISVQNTQTTTSIEGLKIDSTDQVYLLICGKGVLTKKVLQETHEEQLIQTVLPGGDIEQFYAQSTQNNEGHFASIIRKEVVDDLLKEFENHKVTIRQCSVSGVTVTASLKLLQLENQPYGHHVYTDGVYTHSSEVNKEQVSLVDQTTLSAEYIVPYVLGFQVMAKLPLATLTNQNLQEQFINVAHKSLFQKGLKILGGIVLFILVLNTFFFLSFREENAELSSEYNQYEKLLSQKDKLINEVNQKQENLKQAGWLTPSRFSFYADRIASTVPEKIRLTSINVLPLDKKASRKARHQVFEQQTIQIKGLCTTPTVIGTWIEELKKMNWQETVEVEGYEFHQKEKKGDFIIKMTLRN